MTDYGADAPSDFARSTRMPLDAVVRLHFEGTVAFQNGFAANVSATASAASSLIVATSGAMVSFQLFTAVAKKELLFRRSSMRWATRTMRQ